MRRRTTRTAPPVLALTFLLLLSCTSQAVTEQVNEAGEIGIAKGSALDVLACSDKDLRAEDDERADPVDHLSDTESWWRVVDFDLNDFDNPDVWTYLPIVVEPVGSSSSNEELNVRLLSEAHDLFELSMTDDLPLYLGLQETLGGMVELEAIDGSAAITFAEGLPIFGGGCSMRILGGELVLRYEGDPHDLVDDLLSATERDLAQLLLPDNLAE